MKMNEWVRGLVVVVSITALGSAHAGPVVSLYGDKDGFGLGLQSGDGFDFQSLGAGDGDGTDVWRDGDVSYVHNYLLTGTVQSASLELFSGGWGLGGAASLYMNGTFVGHLTNGDNSTGGGPVFNYAFLDIFDLTPFASLLTGHDTFQVRLVDGDDDSGALDYSQLTVTTAADGAIPEPSTLALCGLGMFAAAVAGRRRA